MTVRIRSGLVLLATAAAVAVTGCSKAATPRATSSGGQAIVSNGSAPAPASSPSSAPVPSGASATPPSVSFNGTCSDLLPVTMVNIALHRAVTGKTAFVVGVAEPSIGRLSYLNCRYGIPTAVKGKPAPVAQVEITVSLYDSANRAAQRVESTVEDYLSNGAVKVAAPASTYPSTVLIGYGDPTVVASSGVRTVAVTAKQALFTPTSRSPGLVALAKAVLDATADFNGATTPAPGGAIVAPSGPAAVGSPAAS